MKYLTIILFAITFTACQNEKSANTIKRPILIDAEGFNISYKGRPVELITLQNANGLVAQITNYGGRVVSLWTPDKSGVFQDIVLGCETFDGYLDESGIYFGALIGRYGNRIKNGSFKIDDKEYILAKNNGENHLHGGVNGFNNVVWSATQLDEQSVELTYFSPNGEEGYPGNLDVKVIYTLTDEDELKIEYEAISDQSTPINLTHHSFFNLKGQGNGLINDHVLMINADRYTPVDGGLIPTGELATVEGTPFDFRTPTIIGERLEDENEQLTLGKGYDHNWVITESEDVLKTVAKVVEPQSGRTMEVISNEPGLQFYGGNFLAGNAKGKNGHTYEYRSAFCLETQHFPNSPNQTNFPNTVLEAGEEYRSICIYKFGVEE